MSEFKQQLKEYNLTPQKYLKFAKYIAINRGYNPDFLKLSLDDIHKLKYDDVEFGRVGYKDKIIYTWLEYNNKIPEGTAKMKYTNYRKRAINTMKSTKNKYSPASLSYYILW